MHNLIGTFSDVFNQTLIITAFVLTMMLIIEYINVRTHGNWSKPFERSPVLQIFFGSFIGLIPGCIGAFTVVSLYTHGILSFSAVTAAMISTMGDEAFFMFSTMPKTAFFLSVIVFTIGIVVGLLVLFITKNRSIIKPKKNHLTVHKHQEECYCFHKHDIGSHFKNITFQRALLLGGLAIFLVLLLTGQVGHHHNEGTHEHHGIFAEWGWELWFLFGSTFISLFITATVPDHFIDHHLWGHVIKQHFSRIFFWTIGTLLLIHFFSEYIHIDQWIKSNTLIVLIMAIMVGWIPESGPNLIFITAYLQGLTPFSVLLANSIIQDGHGMLPMLAESKKSYLYIKIINSLVSLVAGLAGYLMGW